MLLGLVLVCGPGLGAGGAVAAESPDQAADTTAAASDSAGAEKVSRFDQPHWVMFRSMIVPGWGQFHNGAYLKAGLVATGEVGLALLIVSDNRKLSDLQSEIDAARDTGNADAEAAAVSAYNDRLNRVTVRSWLLAVLVVYAMTDAYVDAHFKHFKVDFGKNPALEGESPKEFGARVRWEWSF